MSPTLLRCLTLIALGLLGGTDLVPLWMNLGSLATAVIIAMGFPRELRGWGLSMSGMAMVTAMGLAHTIWLTVVGTLWGSVLFIYILKHASRTLPPTERDPGEDTGS